MSINTESLSSLAARKHQLNQLCASAVEQQISQHKAENNHHRNRRRYLARQVQKRLSLQSYTSSQRWLHAVTLVLAMWGFNDLVMPNQVQAAAKFEVSANPLNGFNVGTSRATPGFADIDGDGDLDVFVGSEFGDIKYYRNDGTDLAPGFVAVVGAGNPLDGIDVGSDSLPTFVDIDGDNDLDVFIGENANNINYYRNDGTNLAPNFVSVVGVGNPLDGFGVFSAAPSFVDIDNDGDFDAFVGSSVGTVIYFRNDGTDLVPGFVSVVGAGNPLDGFDVGLNQASARPSFADLDGDGDLDAFVGEYDGIVNYYRNDGTDLAPSFVAVVGTGNPLDGVDVGSLSAPTFVDIDNDGDLDAFSGANDGTVKFYLNSGTTESPFFGVITNPLDGFDVGDLAIPALADIDGDGDLDAFVGNIGGSVKYYRNDGTSLVPAFVAVVGAGNPLDGFDVGFIAAPTLADIDGDGDLDAFVGEQLGNVKYYRNDGTNLAPAFVAVVGAGNPLDGFDVGFIAAPTLADIDGDGDLDAFVGEQLGNVKYYRNDGTNLAPAFVAVVGFGSFGNPLDGFDVGDLAAPTLADIDGDGDLDAFVGEQLGNVNYYRNYGTNLAPAFVAVVGAGNPLDGFNVSRYAAPTLVDIDADGDLDAFVGEKDGTVNYYQNSDPVPVAVEDTLTVTTGSSNTTADVTANDQFKIEVPAQFINISAFDGNSVNGGTVTDNGNNTFTFTPAGGFTGVDSFTYTLSDGVGNNVVGTVTATVSSASSSGGGGGGGGGLLSPWTLLLLPLLTYLRRKMH